MGCLGVSRVVSGCLGYHFHLITCWASSWLFFSLTPFPSIRTSLVPIMCPPQVVALCCGCPSFSLAGVFPRPFLWLSLSAGKSLDCGGLIPASTLPGEIAHPGPPSTRLLPTWALPLVMYTSNTTLSWLHWPTYLSIPLVANILCTPHSWWLALNAEKCVKSVLRGAKQSLTKLWILSTDNHALFICMPIFYCDCFFNHVHPLWMWNMSVWSPLCVSCLRLYYILWYITLFSYLLIVFHISDWLFSHFLWPQRLPPKGLWHFIYPWYPRHLSIPQSHNPLLLFSS